jgi:tRNA(Ile)-lysidine synthase
MKASRMPDVLEKALTAISRYNMLAPGSRVVAAVSGGADSVCLFHVLRELAPRLCFTLAGIAHLNHKLRGEASDEDERFVAAMAAQYGVPFYREESEVASAGGNLEQTARQARREFFGRLIGAEGVRIATGHTRDDQAETVLFRLLRGSGLAGLAGVLPVTREGLIRPMLGVTRSEVEEFLRARGIVWREDATNRDTGFARNRIRHVLLPELSREWNPEISAALARLADTAQAEESLWNAKVKRLAGKLLSNGEIDAARLVALPRAAARRLVRHAAAEVGRIGLDFEHVERVLELAAAKSGRGTLDLPGIRVVRSFDRIRFESHGSPVRLQPIPVSVPGKYVWPGGGTRVCLQVTDSEPAPGGCVRLKLSEGASSAPLVLRGWRAGDHYHPAGRFRNQKIKEMFQQARIPSWRRSSWPILCEGTEILWAREFGASADRVTQKPGPALCVWEEPVENEPAE